jgi:predicted permease
MRPDERDLDDEIRGHLAISIRERIDRGENPEAARLAALREFGYVPRLRDEMRRVWYSRGSDAMLDLASDVRYAVRALVKHRGFSLTVIGVLTLGIGLNAAVFTMVKGMLLSPLAGVANSGRLVVLYGETSTGRQLKLSYPDYRHLRDSNDAFVDLFGSSLVTINLGRGKDARQLSGEVVTGNYFQALGVRAQLGRTLLPSDEATPGQPVVVISDGLWRRDLGADPDIIGRTIDLNNVPLTVVGVTDPSFHGTIVSYDVEVFIPVTMTPQFRFNFERLNSRVAPAEILSDPYTYILSPHGYLRPGMSLAGAAAQVDTIWAARAGERVAEESPQQLRLSRFWNAPTGGQGFMLPTLMVLSAMGLLVLMLACANIAGLVLVRGLSRRGEIAVRLALGATRARIVRLLVIENLVLAAPGAVIGLLLAWRSIPLLVGYAEQMAAPQRIYFNIDLSSLDLTFTAVVACVCALVFGLVPALQSSRISLVSAINEDASPRGAARNRLRTGLVVAQVAVSLLLLVGSGLATRSVEAARRADPGFDGDRVAAIHFDLKQNGYDEARGRAFYEQLLAAARLDPALEAVSLAQYTPLALIDSRMQRVAVEGYAPRSGEDLSFMSNTVAPDYFRTLRIPLLAGRSFDDRDDEAGGRVVVVNHTLAERFWGSADAAVGQRIQITGSDWSTVIGVVADLKYSRINEGPRPYFYQPLTQHYRSAMILHARGTEAVDVVVERARRHVLAVDPQLPILGAKPFVQDTAGAFIFYDLTAFMLFIFGAAGMLLAALGTYGLVSYTVRQSTQEIGIRMALGAGRFSVVRGFLARGLRLGALGAVLGVAAAFLLGGLLRHVLFGVSATDPVSFTQALALVFGVVTAASIVPAWRASRTSPLNALRHL